MCSGWAFCKPYIGQVVGSELDLIVLTGEEEEWAVIQWERSMRLRKKCDENFFSGKEVAKEVLVTMLIRKGFLRIIWKGE
jgi:hypothetical protein